VSTPKSFERREVVAAIGAGIGLVALARITGGSSSPSPASGPAQGSAQSPVLGSVQASVPAPQAVPPAAPAEQVSPAAESERTLGLLRPGSRVGRATVVAIYPVTLGGIPVVLEVAGERFQVDVLRRDASGPNPVASTPSLALFLSNKGDGARDTAEEHGLAVMALAAHLAACDAAGAPVPELLSLNERMHQDAQGFYCVA